MNPVLKRAQDLLELAIKAEKGRLYVFAGIRYIQSFELLSSLASLDENNLISLSPKEQCAIMGLSPVIKDGLRNVVEKMPRQKIRDSAREAFEIILRGMKETL